MFSLAQHKKSLFLIKYLKKSEMKVNVNVGVEVVMLMMVECFVRNDYKGWQKA